MARPRRLLIGLGAAALLGVPKRAAETDFSFDGPWRFVVTAEGAVRFREEHTFRSKPSCQHERDALEQGLGRVAAGSGDGARMRGLARRLRLGPCEAVRRRR
jgi:hypothetical protein